MLQWTHVNLVYLVNAPFPDKRWCGRCYLSHNFELQSVDTPFAGRECKHWNVVSCFSGAHHQAMLSTFLPQYCANGKWNDYCEKHHVRSGIQTHASQGDCAPNTKHRPLGHPDYGLNCWPALWKLHSNQRRWVDSLFPTVQSTIQLLLETGDYHVLTQTAAALITYPFSVYKYECSLLLNGVWYSPKHTVACLHTEPVLCMNTRHFLAHTEADFE